MVKYRKGVTILQINGCVYTLTVEPRFVHILPGVYPESTPGQAVSVKSGESERLENSRRASGLCC